jgi:hypothetical protein
MHTGEEVHGNIDIITSKTLEAVWVNLSHIMVIRASEGREFVLSLEIPTIVNAKNRFRTKFDGVKVNVYAWLSVEQEIVIDPFWFPLRLVVIK